VFFRFLPFWLIVLCLSEKSSSFWKYYYPLSWTRHSFTVVSYSSPGILNYVVGAMCNSSSLTFQIFAILESYAT